ncbi:MAG: patatin-like phospholipase family protein [Armatimonadota bacterium]|nr:patatin-like phospholipase family protein [Armatimonadota bacterium]
MVQGSGLACTLGLLLAVCAAGLATDAVAGALEVPGCGRAGPPAAPPGRLGVVFAGGGAKAAYEAGVALALRERGVRPTVVAGTSSGAVTAVMVALGAEDRLAALWRAVRPEDVIAWRPGTLLGGLLPGWLAVAVLREAGALLDPAPLRTMLAREVDLARLRETPTRVLVLAADLATGESRRFDNGTLTVDALLASATVPGLFPPVRADGGLLVDGGVLERAPILEVLEAHALDHLLVVLGYGGGAPAGTSVRAVLERAFELALAREVLRDAELARWRHPGVDVRVLRPSEPLGVRPLDFDGARLGRLVELGRRDGLECLARLGDGP